jgi:[ribosomal protein S5]-alanine N-acetyltransferase
MELRTQRLVLREYCACDLEAIAGMYGDAEFQRFEGALMNRQEAQEALQKGLNWAQEDPRMHYKFAIALPTEERMIGMVSLMPINPDIQEWEIGWGVRCEDWGRGYASEAAREMLRLAFEELNGRRVVAFCHAENLSSVRVMEKIGMQYEGRLREVRWLNECWNDEFIYSILMREWQHPRGHSPLFSPVNPP